MRRTLLLCILLALTVTPARAATNVLAVPIYAQYDARVGNAYWESVACGPTAVRMVLAYEGRNVALRTLIRETAIPQGAPGLTLDDVATLLSVNGVTNHLGLLTRLAQVKREIDAGRPVIEQIDFAALYGGVSGQHYVVVVGYTDTAVIFIDPYWARRFTVAWSTFFYDARIYALFVGS